MCIMMLSGSNHGVVPASYQAATAALPGGQAMFIRGQRSRKRAWVHARYWMKRGYEVMVIED